MASALPGARFNAGLGVSAGLDATVGKRNLPSMPRRRYAWSLLVAMSFALGGCGDPSGPGTEVRWSQVAAGDFFTCALTTAGKAYCWGAAIFGQLGNDDVVPSATPIAVAGGHTFRALAVGSDHACGLDLGGAAWCWGLNDYRELGLATAACNDKFIFAACARLPMAVSGAHSFDSIVVAGYSSCALTANLTTFCWGWNVHGQVGSGPVGGVVNAPAQILSSRRFVALTLDISHACGVMASDSIFCWGSNIYGQLGADTLQTPRCPLAGGTPFYCTVSPVYSGAGLVASRVSAGSTHTCALNDVGDAWCWGSNEYGVLGNSTALGGRVPVPVLGGHAWSMISSGADHTCALDNGAAWCWGVNTYGQLGVATVSEACHAFISAQVCRTTPIAVASGVAFASISAGSSHTCALTSEGDIWCWGRGIEGQLGDGLSQTSSAPVRVATPGGA